MKIYGGTKGDKVFGIELRDLIYVELKETKKRSIVTMGMEENNIVLFMNGGNEKSIFSNF